MFRIMHSYTKVGYVGDAKKIHETESIAEAKRYIEDNYLWSRRLGHTEYDYAWFYGWREVGFLWLEIV